MLLIIESSLRGNCSLLLGRVLFHLNPTYSPDFFFQKGGESKKKKKSAHTAKMQRMQRLVCLHGCTSAALCGCLHFKLENFIVQHFPHASKVQAKGRRVRFRHGHEHIYLKKKEKPSLSNIDFCFRKAITFLQFKLYSTSKIHSDIPSTHAFYVIAENLKTFVILTRKIHLHRD